jgi:hypothetical protein
MAGEHGRRAAIALAAALALAGCGGEEGPGSSGSKAKAKPVGDPLVGSVAQLAQCRDWKRGSRAERVATIEDIREQINLEDSAVKTPKLSNAAAYRVLDNNCARPYTDGLRLYKLYARAASFAPFTEKGESR